MPAWEIPDTAAPYLQPLHQAEARYGIPHGLLVRVAYQESHFRPDIISGKVKSSAGAIGIMQLVPKWHPDVNPYNPIESIDYAGRYLKHLHDRFGSWHLALAAYNWGPGNLAKHGLKQAPQETQNYIAQITKDTGVT